MCLQAEKESIRHLLIDTILKNDHILFKSLLDSINLSRTLRELLHAKNELGGFTPLQFVCFQGNSTLASMLINTGRIDVNEKGEFDWTALHAAVFSGDVSTVKLLLNSCADCFARDENNSLPIDFAGNKKIYKLLYDTMIEKNTEKFQKISAGFKSKRKGGRSISCQVGISTKDLTELKEDLLKNQRRTVINTSTSQELSELNIIKKWKTHPDLTQLIE